MSMNRPLQVAFFATDLGWMGVLGVKARLRRIVFGYPSRAAAFCALDGEVAEQAQGGNWWPSLVDRLREYAAGRCVDFRDVQLDLDHLTPFQQRVLKHCRAIGYGKTRSYGELALLAGSPRAARAVGSTMAGNLFPIVVPCHRVINSNGSVGRYSGPEGERMKIKLLAMERRFPAPARRPAKRATRGLLLSTR